LKYPPPLFSPLRVLPPGGRFLPVVLLVGWSEPGLMNRRTSPPKRFMGLCPAGRRTFQREGFRRLGNVPGKTSPPPLILHPAPKRSSSGDAFPYLISLRRHDQESDSFYPHASRVGPRAEPTPPSRTRRLRNRPDSLPPFKSATAGEGGHPSPATVITSTS